MKKLLFFILAFILVNCNGGIEPGLQQPGFSGTIYFKGEWPDSVNLTILVLFKNELKDSSDFSAENLSYVSELIPKGVKKYQYNTLKNSLFGKVDAGTYDYLAVAQSPKKTISLSRADWTIAGIYYSPTDSTHPGKVIIPENTFVEHLDITCDFNNPPPQPPGGN